MKKLFFALIIFLLSCSPSSARWNPYLAGPTGNIPIGTIAQVTRAWSSTTSGGFIHYTVIMLKREPLSGCLDGAATATGVITEVSYYARLDGDIRIKVFRDDGTNYLLIYTDGSGRAVTTGLNNITGLSIAVQAGDFLGFYFETNETGAHFDAGNTCAFNATAYKGGDVTADSAKATWAAFGYLYPEAGGIISSP